MTHQIVGQDGKTVLDPQRHFLCGQCGDAMKLQDALKASPDCPNCKELMCPFCGCTERAPCLDQWQEGCSWTDLGRVEALCELLMNPFVFNPEMPICDKCFVQIVEYLFFQTGRLVVDEFGDFERVSEIGKVKPFIQPVRPALVA